MKCSRHAGIPFVTVLCLLTYGCIGTVLDVDVKERSRTAEASESLNRSVPVINQARLRVTGANGPVHVVGLPHAEAVTIRATKRVRSATLEDARAGLEDLEVHVEATPEEVRVETIQPDDADTREYVVEYEITVPAKLSVTGVSANGPVILENLRSDVDLMVGNGNTTLTDIEGSARVALGNGNLEASMAFPDHGEIAFSVGNGTLSLSTQTGVSAELTARVGNGTISITGLNVTDPVSEPGQFRGILGSGTGLINLSVGNGNIRMQGSQGQG